PIRHAQRLVDSKLSGTFQTRVGIRRADGRPVGTPEVLGRVAELQEWVDAQPDVVKTWSIADPLRELNMAAHGGDARYRVLPDDAGAIDQYLLLLRSGHASEVNDLLDGGGQQIATIVIGTTDLGTTALMDLHARLIERVRTMVPALDVRFTGDYWHVSLG